MIRYTRFIALVLVAVLALFFAYARPAYADGCGPGQHGVFCGQFYNVCPDDCEATCFYNTGNPPCADIANCVLIGTQLVCKCRVCVPD